MNTASLELSKELYELSGWAGTERYFQEGGTVWHNLEDDVSVENSKFVCFAYDLGFLLRKLPYRVESPIENGVVTVYSSPSVVRHFHDRELWLAEYKFPKDKTLQFADNPEDAVAELAIELFKQGILKKEVD